MGSNTEKKPWTNLQNLYKNLSKGIKSDNVARKVGRAITKGGAIEKVQYCYRNIGTYPISHFNSTNFAQFFCNIYLIDNSDVNSTNVIKI